MRSRTLFAAALALQPVLASGNVAHAAGLTGALSLIEVKEADLVSDLPGVAASTDPNLVDPWGAAFQPTGPFWINDRGDGLSTLYDGAGGVVAGSFVVPAGQAGTGRGQPTGIVANPTRAFDVPGTTLASAFIFATLDGTISAWAPGLATNPTTAVIAVDRSSSHAVYTGLDFGITSHGGFLYAADVASGSIEVFDTSFRPATVGGSFRDPAIPSGYAPFNVRNLDGNLYVTYALQNATRTFVQPGAGLGFVDEYDTDGHLLARIASGGTLNAPWGLARAPGGFGVFAGSTLVGNFGDGHISAHTGAISVPLLDDKGAPVAIPGLWSLVFGGAKGAAPDTLFFTAGIGEGKHGLFGSFTPVVPIP